MTVCDPDVESDPLQAPAAVQDVAFVEDQVSVTVPLVAMSDAEDVNVTVG